MASEQDVLDAIHAETVDRFGALPEQVEVLFAIASLRLEAARLGVQEISTFKEQIRIAPVDLPEAMRVDLADRVEGATYHRAKQTLNLSPDRVFGADLVRWVRAGLHAALGSVPAA